MRITSVAGTELFVGGDPADPLQVVRVTVDQPGPLWIDVAGDGVAGTGQLAPGATVAEIPVRTAAPVGTVVPVTATPRGAEGGPATGEFVVAEPGWTVWMVSHFHYDPVWWTTQAAYTATWGAPGQLGNEIRADFQQTGFELVRLHLETARRDPDYSFVLAELDYLKPYWDSHPQDRAYLRQLIAEDRLELMGGTYNEPNTNLTSAETTIRNLVYGVGFQRDVFGGDPRTAWQLDAFGHDPQFPGLVAAAGLDSSSWARGPFHQWGPMLWTHTPDNGGWGDPAIMQFSSEFEWLSPSGQGVLTHYMPAHYSAGWRIDSTPSLAAAEASVYEMFLLLKRVAATRNVLLPVGTDYTPPAKWVTDIHRDWNARYLWPRFVCGLPRQFFGAVREQLRAEGRRVSAQTRDMNPVYTGKDVSFIDTKQAQRHVEVLLTDAEKFATIAAATGAPYPHAAVDAAWRQLVFGAHHDAITGSESDQVYLDLLTGWRQAYDLAREVLDASLLHLSSGLSGVVVFNPSSWARTDLVTVRLSFPSPGTHGVEGVAALLTNPARYEDGSLASVDVTFLAADVPPVGYRTFTLTGTAGAAEVGWRPVPDAVGISNETHRLVVDPARGGTVADLTDLRDGRQVLQPGRLGNELLVYDEYPAHPRFHEGPWHLVPKGGPVAGSAQAPATSVLVETSPLGERVTVTGAVGPARYTQVLTLWRGLDRIDGSTRLDVFTGTDQLIRLRWPVSVPGALPVSEVAHAVIGRGFGLIDVDSEQTPWTLDNPAQHWFALSATARVEVHDPDGSHRHTRAIGIAEIVTPARDTGDPGVRELAVALVRQGVTATWSSDAGTRYGTLAIDSNLPDVRITVGGPDVNAFTAEVLANAEPGYAEELARQLADTGRARVWVPAVAPLVQVWQPHADLTGARTLPVLIVAGPDEVARLTADVATATVPVYQPALAADVDPDLDCYTVALVNRGVPGFAVDATGALHLSLIRSCTGWPSGGWVDPPRRTAPDGSNFEQQHWTHDYGYALVTAPGDWRDAGLAARGHDVNHPLLGRPTPDSTRPAADSTRPAADSTRPAADSTRPAAEGSAGGRSPGARSFVSVEPAGQVVLSALKPAGNPLARGAVPGESVDRVTVRLYEATGRPAAAEVRLWAPVTRAHEADLLEEARGGPAPVADGAVQACLDGAGINQWTIDVVPAGHRAPVAPAAATPAQYSRYWLHNIGPAPVGNLPVAVHLEPAHATVNGPVTLAVTVASDHSEQPVSGRIELVVADGWQCEPSTVDYKLEPGGHAAHSVLLTPPEGVSPGVYWARARITQGKQTVEDVTRLLVGVEAPERVEATLSSTSVQLRPGGSADVELRLTSDAQTPITVAAHLIGPWHTWELLPTAEFAVEIPARGEATVRLPVRVPEGYRPGTWWALLRLGYAGQLHYTEPVSIEVLG